MTEQGNHLGQSREPENSAVVNVDIPGDSLVQTIGSEAIFTVPTVHVSTSSRDTARLHFPTVVVDEAHQQAWTTRKDIAKTINPVQPADSSFVRASEQLQRDGFHVVAHTEGLIQPSTLDKASVLVIPHLSDPRFERTIGIGDHSYTSDEIAAIVNHVEHGGGLVVLAEHENDKYGTNINELLSRFGMTVDHSSAVDPITAHNNVASWIRPQLHKPGQGLLTNVSKVILYRAGTLTTSAETDVDIIATTSSTADPADKPTIVTVRHGLGRVVVVTDSDLFGDDSVDDGDHLRLLSNLVTWAANGHRTEEGHGQVRTETPSAWSDLKDAVTTLRSIQNSDGSVDLTTHDRASVDKLVERIASGHEAFASLHPHDKNFHVRCAQDLRRWSNNGFTVPDYLDALVEFRPDLMRVDGLEHVVVMPMYTQNGNPDRVFEAVWIRTVWPSWINELEGSGYDNAAFVPIEFVDFTEGYNTHSAVLFPETVAVRSTPKFHWGAIFCDREAARFRAVVTAASNLLHLELPPAAEQLINNAALTKETFVLWDLVHDRTHMHGELPFDPFMIKQRIPYWMYALEELRCDLNAYNEMDGLYHAGIPHAPLVKYAILFDRLLRFPITGDRTKNYDGLVGQIIFAQLHQRGVLRWVDNRLSFDWDTVDSAMNDLHTKVNELYRSGIDKARIGFWKEAHTLVSGLVASHPASLWASGLDFTLEPRKLVDAVLPDEFPMNMFYESLAKKLAPVIEANKGITL
jgi:hypothetical protein